MVSSLSFTRVSVCRTVKNWVPSSGLTRRSMRSASSEGTGASALSVRASEETELTKYPSRLNSWYLSVSWRDSLIGAP